MYSSHSLLLLALTTLLAVGPVPSYCAPFTMVNATTLPTIILVPGAFHVDSSMDVLGSQLEQSGYNTRTFGLITVNRAKVNVQQDARAFKAEILYPLIDQQGKDVVVYLHSYAGFPGSTAIKGYSKEERVAAAKKVAYLVLSTSLLLSPRKEIPCYR